MLDKLRTRLRDIAFGRTKIRVVSIDHGRQVQPVFLIGTFRSGTTLLRFLLDSHSRVCCPPETKFMRELAALREAATWEAFQSLGLEEDYLRNEIRRLASAFYQPYLSLKGKEILVDKTPEYVRCLPFIDWLYAGQCKYILIYRNGLDVAQSMQNTPIAPLEGNKTLDNAFAYWMHDTRTMLDWRDAHPERCYPVVYDAMCDQPETVVTGILEYLGLEWEQGVMDWHRQGHDRGFEDIKARRRRTIVASIGNYGGWPADRVAEFKEAAAALHSRIGFDPQSLSLP